MKKTFLFLIAAFSFLLSGQAAEKAKHVVLIGLDGWGAYSVSKAEIPNIRKMMNEGCYTLKKRSALPSSSAINWASMFMGAGPELHGYTQWGSKVPELPSREVTENGIFPTIFYLLHKARPEAEIGCLYEWEGIKYLADTLALDYHAQAPDYNKHPEALCGMAEKYINLKSATKLFSVLLASKRPLITELADKLRLKYPLLPTISPCPTMRLEAIRSIIPISCRRYPKSV